MPKPLRILIVEDSEDDLLLILRHLRQSGYEPIFERVYTPAALKAALEIPTWDVILCDYVMPQLSVSEALKLSQEKGLDVPFIVISGVFGEYLAARAIAAGAHDYIVKGDLGRLASAIEEARWQAEVRRAEKQGKTAGESSLRTKRSVTGR
jgi:CheY-like chemotaxis protein